MLTLERGGREIGNRERGAGSHCQRHPTRQSERERGKISEVFMVALPAMTPMSGAMVIGIELGAFCGLDFLPK